MEIVLSAWKKAPYEPLNLANLRALTLKTVFLVAVLSARRASEIHSLRFDTLRFSTHGVTAFTDLSFRMKVDIPWHVTHSIELPSLSDSDDAVFRLLCVRLAMKLYCNRTLHKRERSGSSQLFLWKTPPA